MLVFVVYSKSIDFVVFENFQLKLALTKTTGFWSTFFACIVAFRALLDAIIACLNIGVADSLSYAL